MTASRANRSEALDDRLAADDSVTETGPAERGTPRYAAAMRRVARIFLDSTEDMPGSLRAFAEACERDADEQTRLAAETYRDLADAMDQVLAGDGEDR